MTLRTFLLYHQLETIPQIKHQALTFTTAKRFQFANTIVIKIK